MDTIRLELLQGRISLPSYQKFIKAIGSEATELADRMFKAMWNSYLRNKGNISLPYWADLFNDAQTLNIIIKSLSKAGWIESHAIPARNWAEANIREEKLLEYLHIDELETVRASNKFTDYILKIDPSTKTEATRVNGKVTNTGLVREGFCKAGNTLFSYDQQYMSFYQPIIQRNLTKSMDKIAQLVPNLRHDRASYDTISCEILDYHLETGDKFTRGHNYNDSRGRAISSSLSKVANPISCKDFRSMLTIN